MLRVVVQNSWPNLEYSAEREFIPRLSRACANLGWECIEAVTSQEILDAKPDCVLVTHEFSPKLTEIPTVGLIWSPPDFYRHDPARIRSILSYDGYLAGSESVRDYLRDLLFSTQKETPISEWDFLPTAPKSEYRKPNLVEPTLFYTGVHWDGDRHGDLITRLTETLPMGFYGDPSRWQQLGTAYKGTIPFDGKAIFDRIHEAGIALCLHRSEHLKYDVPSMRVFEAAAAGAVVITEASSFVKRHFGDSVLYLDNTADIGTAVAQIRAHYEWIRSNPADAVELTRQAHAIFSDRFSLETLLTGLPTFLARIRTTKHFDVGADDGPKPKVDVIVRVGGRGIDFVERCVDSLAKQSHQNLGLILVSYRPVAGLDCLLAKYQRRFTSLKHIQSAPTGFRSTSLWDGLREVEGDYFCNQDDDDSLHPNHISSMVALLESHSNYSVAYSGTIKVQDEPGHYFDQINFSGPLGKRIEENRQLIFLDPFQRARLLRFDNFIQSNSWLARRSALTRRDLEDPKLTVAEDVYLYFLFLRRGDFLFSWMPTANWHWRSTSKDNSMLKESQMLWAQSIERIQLRTQYFGFGREEVQPKIVASGREIAYSLKMHAAEFLRRVRSRFGAK